MYINYCIIDQANIQIDFLNVYISLKKIIFEKLFFLCLICIIGGGRLGVDQIDFQNIIYNFFFFVFEQGFRSVDYDVSSIR